jgi:hypothetical protein
MRHNVSCAGKDGPLLFHGGGAGAGAGAMGGAADFSQREHRHRLLVWRCLYPQTHQLFSFVVESDEMHR